MSKCCMDCGNRLEQFGVTESSTKWYCAECNSYWFQTRRMVVEWTKQPKPYESDNGGINAPVATTNIEILKRCCECQNVIDIQGNYGVNGYLYYCADCMNTDY